MDKGKKAVGFLKDKTPHRKLVDACFLSKDIGAVGLHFGLLTWSYGPSGCASRRIIYPIGGSGGHSGSERPLEGEAGGVPKMIWNVLPLAVSILVQTSVQNVDASYRRISKGAKQSARSAGEHVH